MIQFLQVSNNEIIESQSIAEFRAQNPESKIIGTHSGSFHPDEACACAVLLLVHANAVILRTRDMVLLAECDYRVDVGEKDNKETGDFDHHQEKGAGKRVNQIEYSSFGLVWAAFGELIAGDRRIAQIFDKQIVQTIDAIDNGQNITIPCVDFQGARPFNMHQVLASFNPPWDEDKDLNFVFMEVVALARKIIRNTIERFKSQKRAVPYVRMAMALAEDARIVVLDRICPWKHIIINESPSTLFVVYPDDEGQWCVQAVPSKTANYQNRLDLPAAWAKTNGHTFADLSGVPDATFIHRKLFICGAKSKEGALALARLAIELAPKEEPEPASPELQEAD